MSERLIISHYENNYGGAVKRLNLIEEKLAELRRTNHGYQALARSFDFSGIICRGRECTGNRLEDFRGTICHQRTRAGRRLAKSRRHLRPEAHRVRHNAWR